MITWSWTGKVQLSISGLAMKRYLNNHTLRTPKDTKRGYAVEIVFCVENIDDYYMSVKTFANVVEPLVKQPWGMKDFRIEDPFGFYLRISEPHNILQPDNAVD